MTDTESTTSVRDSWIALFEAFCAIGEAEFGDAWDKDCSRLGPFDHDDIPPLVDAGKIDPATYAENPSAWDDIDFATSDQVKQFGHVDSVFRGAMWEGDIQVRLLNSQGTVVPLEKSKWRSNLVHIYWLNSEVWLYEGTPEKLASVLKAELSKEGVLNLASGLKRERRRIEVSEIRKKAATGKRAELYDWEFIDEVILQVYQDNAPRNLRIGSGKVTKHLKQLGWGFTDQQMDNFQGIPSDSAIEKRIRKLKRINKISI